MLNFYSVYHQRSLGGRIFYLKEEKKETHSFNLQIEVDKKVGIYHIPPHTEKAGKVQFSSGFPAFYVQGSVKDRNISHYITNMNDCRV